MSEEQLKAFLEKVKGDTSLQEKLKAVTNLLKLLFKSTQRRRFCNTYRRRYSISAI